MYTDYITLNLLNTVRYPKESQVQTRVQKYSKNGIIKRTQINGLLQLSQNNSNKKRNSKNDLFGQVHIF